MSVGAPPGVISDTDPLQTSTVDVPSRAGWLLRMARLTAPGLTPTLQQLAVALDTSAARLHRLETGKLRNGRLISSYEAALGFPEGSLRAPIDVLCRTFPARALPDQDPGPFVSTANAMSGLTSRVSVGAGSVAKGADWLGWARSISQPGAIGMPLDVARGLVGHLVDEMNRSVGSAYPTRYEALALIRTGPYGEVLVDVARDKISDPHVQVLFDLMSAVGEAVTPDATHWCLDLLADRRDRVLTAAVLALENMGTIGGTDDFWSDVASAVIPQLNASHEGGARATWLSHLARLVPASVWAGVAVRPDRPLTPPADIPNWSRSRSNRHWLECQAWSRQVTDAANLDEQPMLTRLIFDIVVSPFESHAVTSYMLLGALPQLASGVYTQLAATAATHPDPVIRARVGRRLVGMQQEGMPEVAAEWLESTDADLRDTALLIAGCSGTPVPDEILEAALAGGVPSQRAALHVLGMSGHPLLCRLQEHADPAIAGGARWWLRTGSRIVESP